MSRFTGSLILEAKFSEEANTSVVLVSWKELAENRVATRSSRAPDGLHGAVRRWEIS